MNADRFKYNNYSGARSQNSGAGIKRDPASIQDSGSCILTPEQIQDLYMIIRKNISDDQRISAAE